MVSIGRITDEGVENLGARVGSYYKGGPTLVEITEDAIYNYAVDNGDANPLYIDPDYAARSRFGGIIAPPAIVDVIKHYTAGMVGGLAGVHQFHSGNDITFYRPVRLGDRIGTVYRPYKMSEKQGQFAGRMISIDVIIWYFNQRGEIVAKAHGPCFRVERQQARERGKYKEVEKTRYTDKQLQEIWDAYDREEMRGDTPRYWEDVNEGDEIPTIVRGPLRIGEIAFRSVYGGGRLGGAGALAEGAHIYHLNEYRKRAGFAETSETGVDDHPHRGHWEDRFARFIGVPGAYDVAVMRTHWMSMFLTNWIGDHGWLKRVWNQFRLFNVEGDANWIYGKITRKWKEGPEHLVEVDVWIENQRGDVSTPGGAIAVLPSRDHESYVPGNAP